MGRTAWGGLSGLRACAGLGRPLHHQILKLGEKAPLTRGLPTRVDRAAQAARRTRLAHTLLCGLGSGWEGHARAHADFLDHLLCAHAGPCRPSREHTCQDTQRELIPTSTHAHPGGSLRPTSKCSDSERLSIG